MPELLDRYTSILQPARGGDRPSSMTLDISLLLKRPPDAADTSAPDPKAPILMLSDVRTHS